jgi:hypothetical protein
MPRLLETVPESPEAEAGVLGAILYDGRAAITVLVASVVGILSYGLAMRLGIIVGALAGIAAGIVADAWWGQR